MKKEMYPERNAEIVRRRKSGEWPHAIARAMGLSHNAVIGVCNRAGLSKPENYRAEVLRGEELSAAILCDDSVREIRARRTVGRPRHPGNTEDLAREFGVSVSTIVEVAKGKSWAHVQ